MTRETRICAVETSVGWHLSLFELSPPSGSAFYRIEIVNPEGRAVLVKSGCASKDDAFETVRNFFDGQKLRHTATVLVEMCKAELR